ncbi:MAG: hypothetical protein HZC18_00990 [Candidatus Omnitrophica bacterium]|nr:hypothetical protein [Candidatus Omnitrophota bacterium]
MNEEQALKPLSWIGSSRENLKELPEEVRQDVGFALFEVQRGQKPATARPLKGAGGAGIINEVNKS